MREAMFAQVYPVVRRSVRVRAAAVRLTAADREDLEQEAALRTWLALARFDSGLGSLVTLTECVVRNEVASFLRSRRFRRPWEVALETNERILTEADRNDDLCCDVRRVLRKMELADRVVARELSEQSVTETSRQLGISRAATYRSIRRLRAAFASAGLINNNWNRSCRGA
jgi:RNA polymerase sigma factor (sigma-70 family)